MAYNKQIPYYMILLFCLISISMVSSLSVDIPVPTTFSNIPTVNNSEYFDGYSVTSLWTLYETYVLGLGKWDDYLLLAGGIMTGAINMNNNNIINGGGGSYFNRTLTIDGDIGDENADATLVITSGNNLHACINLTEAGGNLGFQICNDGSGTNRLVFSNAHDGYEWMWIDRDDGTINFLNDTVFTNLIVENVNSTGNVTGDYFLGDGSQLTGITSDNSTWNQSLAELLFLKLNGGTLTGNLAINKTNPRFDLYLTGAVQQSSVSWHEADGTTGGFFTYNGEGVATNPKSFNIGTFQTGGRLRFSTGGNELALFLDEEQNATFYGNVTAPFYFGDGSQLTGITSDNSTWNEVLANSLYYSIFNPSSFWNDSYATFNKTYADTLYLQTESDPLWSANETSYKGLINDSMADALHRHSELSSSDGSNTGVLVSATGTLSIRPEVDGASAFTVNSAGNALRFRVDTTGGDTTLYLRDASDVYTVGLLSNGASYINGGSLSIGGAGTLSLDGTAPSINTGTTDGSDNKRMQITGGGATSITRGAYFNLNGNEYATNPGWVTIGAGNIAGADGSIVFQTAGADNVVIKRGGNVGIGTTSPATYGGKLVVVGASPQFTVADNSIQAFITMEQRSNVAYITRDNGDNLVLGSKTDSTQTTIANHMTIDTAGNVGIGTSTPNAKLQIVGNLNVTGNVYIGGCLNYNCSSPSGCVTLGSCV